MCNFFRSPLIWYNPNISHCTNVHHMQFGIGTVSRKGIRNSEGFFHIFLPFFPVDFCRSAPRCCPMHRDTIKNPWKIRRRQFHASSSGRFSYLQSGRRLKGCTKLGNGSGRVESSSSTVHRKITHDFFRLPEFRAIIDHQLVSAMQLFLKKGIPQSRDIVCNYV